MVLFGSTIFSRLKSALSNSEGVTLRLVTSTLNLVFAGTFNEAGSNLWFCSTRWNSGVPSACVGSANAAVHANIRTGNHGNPRIVVQLQARAHVLSRANANRSHLVTQPRGSPPFIPPHAQGADRNRLSFPF